MKPFLQKIAEMWEEGELVAMHYACSDITSDNFEITSICLYFPDRPNPIFQLSRRHMTEGEMLEKFWHQMKGIKRVIGWNIGKPEIFGLEVLMDRHISLGGKPTTLPEEIDLDMAMQRDGLETAPAKLPKLMKYAKLNRINTYGYRTWKEEIRLAEEKQYLKIDMSVQRKCRIIARILDRISEGRFRTSLFSVPPEIARELLREAIVVAAGLATHTLFA